MYNLHTVFENEKFFASKVVLARISSKKTLTASKKKQTMLMRKVISEWQRQTGRGNSSTAVRKGVVAGKWLLNS